MVDSHDGGSQLLIPLPGVPVSRCTSWGEGAGDTCCCAAAACFPFGEKEGRRRKVPTECPMTQLVPEWEGDGWISGEAACSWVMKWQFRTGENLKGQPGVDSAINSPSLMFHWVTAFWLDYLMEHAGGEMMLWGVQSPSSKDILLSAVNFSSDWEGKTEFWVTSSYEAKVRPWLKLWSESFHLQKYLFHPSHINITFSSFCLGLFKSI